MQATEPQFPAPRVIAGFWRRLAALMIDSLLLGLLGWIIGYAFFDALAGWGSYGLLLGLVIELAYLGVLNSHIGGGQTLGKRWLGVRVVGRDGQLLALPRSLLRTLVFVVPWLFNGAVLDIGAVPSFAVWLVGVLVIGGALSSTYLYVFNRRSRQVLHDLAVGSYVIDARVAGIGAEFPSIWRGHLWVVAFLLLLAMGLPLLVTSVVGRNTWDDLLAARSAVMQLEPVRSAAVSATTNYNMGGASIRGLNIVLVLKASHVHDRALAKAVASEALRNYSAVQSWDTIMVQLRYGFDIGIADGWLHESYAFKPDELRQDSSEAGPE